MKHKFWAVTLAGALAMCVGLAGCGENSTGTFGNLQKMAENLVGSRITQEQLSVAEEELLKDGARYTTKTVYTLKYPIFDEDDEVLFYWQNEIYTVHTVDGIKHHITQTYRSGLDLLGKKTFEITEVISDRNYFPLSDPLPCGIYTDEELTQEWAKAWNEKLHEERQEELEEVERDSLEKNRVNVEEGVFGREYVAWDVYQEDTAEGSFCYWKCYDGSCIKQRGDATEYPSIFLYDNSERVAEAVSVWDVETLPHSEEFLGWKAEHPRASLKEFFDSVEFEDFRTSVGERSKVYSGYDEATKGYMGYMTDGAFCAILKFDRAGKVVACFYPESFVSKADFSHFEPLRYFHTVIEYNETEVVLPARYIPAKA